MKIVATSRDWWEEKKGFTAFLHDGTRCKVFEDTKRPIWAVCDYWLVPITEIGDNEPPPPATHALAYMVNAERYFNDDGYPVCICPRFGMAYQHYCPGQPEVRYAIVNL